MGHLKDTNETYFQHWAYAMQFGLVLIMVGLCVIVHAFFPGLFTNTGSKAVKAMASILEQDGR